MSIQFALEAPHHGAAIDAILAQAFDAGWPTRPASKLRRGQLPMAGLSRVALRDGTPVGTIRHYPVRFGHAGLPGLMLGPVAVLPEEQGRGIARALIRTSLAHAKAWGWQRVLLVGDPAYYGRLGFEMAGPHGLTLAGSDDRLMVQALAPAGLDGIAGPVSADGGVRQIA